jgi:hypothetical protein
MQTCPASRIWFYENAWRLFLYMVVFGMVISAGISSSRNQTGNFGVIKLMATERMTKQ